ncbi:MAG TPA: hypothetical protein VHS59_06610, partial [Bacillota bacterium]|nr:hypothetical protein [Bacillota bacterium]
MDRKHTADQVTEQICREFGLSTEKAKFIHGEEIVLPVPKVLLVTVCSYIRTHLQGILTTMVGNDEREVVGKFALYYTFSLDQLRLFLTVRTEVEPGVHRCQAR